MKNLLTCLALAGLALPTLAAPAAADAASAPAAKKAPTAQQAKMTACNADAKAKDLKGDERKAFMKTCLSASKQEKQQDKMTSC
ncbi:PsiF family protein, partial [Pulveribacter sp.]